MGLSSNLEVFLSDKHHNKDREFAAALPPARPASTEESGFQSPTKQELKTKQTVQEDSNNVPLGLKKLKIPPPYKEEENEGPNDGFKTPTSPEQRIPAVLQCPPAPRKPKTAVSPPKKRRKGGCNPRQVVVGLSQEIIECLFPAPFAAAAGEKNKKAKLFTEPR